MGQHQVTAECHSFTHQSLIHSTNVNQPEATDFFWEPPPMPFVKNSLILLF